MNNFNNSMDVKTPGFPTKRGKESKDFTASRNEGIKRAYLETLWLSKADYENGYILWRNIDYRIETDLFLDAHMKNHPIAKVVGSFQIYYPFAAGKQDAVAVMRLHRDLVPTTLKGTI